MLNIAVVEDDPKDMAVLRDMLRRYGAESGQAVAVKGFLKPLEFLSAYRSDYEIIFLDVDMPACNGFETAERIRSLDDTAVIVFVTNMANYAAEGYKVDATDYMVKPVTYADFCGVMRRAGRRLSVRKRQTHTIRSNEGVACVDISEIMYVEVAQHRLFYHMAGGEVREAWGTIKQLEGEFPPDRFVRCNSCYLVNLQFVRGVKNDIALVGGDELRVSRPRRQAFIDALVAYAGE